MCTGIALYNTDSLSSQKAFLLAQYLFDLLNLEITDTAYYSGSNKYYAPAINASLHELKKLINAGKIQDFRVYHKDNDSLPWAASFGYSTQLNDDFCHIDIQYIARLVNEQEILINFFKKAIELCPIPYGIVFYQDNIVDAFDYTIGEGVIPLPSYEKQLIWREETPGRFAGPARYKDNMLRMIYPYNLLNSKHLSNIKLQGQTLGDWINSSQAHGTLGAIAEDSFLWIVPTDQIVAFNSVFGKEGLLISWQQPSNFSAF